MAIKKKQTKLKTNVPSKFKAGFLKEMDGRCDLAKTLRQNYEAIIADVGGIHEVSHVKNALVERFVWLESILQTLEHEMATGQIDRAEALGRWIAAVNSMSALAKTLGLDRRATSKPWLEASSTEVIK
ncbi:MAG: hypothetical protein R3C28_20995 [Pirellulaceae bacterium]